ncbi:MAG TPA: ABC transporter permease [Gammaproteobacteria bacterium]|nr:ABC transporter permease [Gammaproteobacteria bacterium]
MLSNLVADVRYSLRSLARRPGFAAVIVLTLAGGIAINVAIYSMFEQILLRPLPVVEPERLVNLSSPGLKRGGTSCNDAGSCDTIFSYPMFRDLEGLDGPFAGVAAHRAQNANFAFGGQSSFGKVMLVSGSYFPLLGVQPALGRLLGPGDDAVDGEASAAVLSHGYWNDALGADPAVLGKTLVVNGKPFTVVGVAPPEFRGTTIGLTAQVFVPITFIWSNQPARTPIHQDRNYYWTYLFARLKPGVTLEEASAAINPPYHAIINDVEAPRLTGVSAKDLAAFRAKVVVLEPGARGQSSVRANARAPLTVLALATTLVLLIACVNVANLMLARGADRGGEVAIRTSLGAAPLRIAGLLVVEAVLLALAAGLVSVPLELATARGIVALLPRFASATFAPGLDSVTLALTAALALGSALAFGLSPAFKLARTPPGRVLQAQTARSTGGKTAKSFRAVLTTAQIGLSMTLLVLAGWFAQSLANAFNVDVGFRTDSLVTFTVSPERNGYDQVRTDAFFDRLEAELGALAGVSSVTSSMVNLLGSSTWGTNVAVEGFDSASAPDFDILRNSVGPDFFGTLEMPLVAGRSFTAADSRDRPKVAVVNQRFVELFGLGSSALGKHMSTGQGGPLDIEIVGVVHDAKYDEVKAPIVAQLFLPRLQSAAVGTLTFYVRSASDPVALRQAIQQVLARLDPTLPIMDLRTMRDVVRENLFVDRTMSVLGGSLAVLATLLASLGLYGVLSYNLAQRTREIGLRLALGAAPARLRSMVLREVATMAAIGGVAGLAVALLLGQLARSLLYGLAPTDPAVPAIAVAVLAVTAGAAGYLPARRASRVDPMVALRTE